MLPTQKFSRLPARAMFPSFAQPKKHHGQRCVRNNVSSFTRTFKLSLSVGDLSTGFCCIFVISVARLLWQISAALPRENFHRLQVYSTLWLCPSCATRKKTAIKKCSASSWLRKVCFAPKISRSHLSSCFIYLHLGGRTKRKRHYS